MRCLTCTGRFPQVSNIIFKFDPKAEAGSRVKSILIGGMQLEMEKRYVLATRDYMARGKGMNLTGVAMVS